MMDSDDSGPFSLTQPLTDAGGYPVSSTSVTNQYHVWAAASTATNISNNSTTSLPTHFSPVSPSGHGLYSDHLTLHPAQSAVDSLSLRLGQGDYHSSTADRLVQGDAYHATPGTDSSNRHPASKADYHDHLIAQDRHLNLDSYHHISASSSSSTTSAQQQDRLASSDYHSTQSADRLAQSDYHSGQQSGRLARNDYHAGQQSDRLPQNEYHSAQQSERLGQSEYHPGQQAERLGQTEYHVASQSDRLGQLDYSSGQGERLQAGLSKQDYHGMGGEQLAQHTCTYHAGQAGQQQAAGFHSAQAGDRTLGTQADYHSTQVDLDAVGMHAEFDRRHLDVSLLPKDLVDSGQRVSAIDYLASQTSRDTLAGLHPDIVGLPREIDLSVGQTVSPPQRSAPADLASTSYSLDPTTLPRDLSPYGQRDLDHAMLSASDVVGQVPDGSSHSAAAAAAVSLHPQDLAGINLTATSRDLVDMTSLTRSGTGRTDLGRGRDLHRPREIHTLEALDSLNSIASVDLTLNGGSSTKSSSRTYPSTSRLTSSTKRQTVPASQATDIRTQNPLSAVAVNSSSAGIGFFSLPTSRDPLNIMAATDPSVAGASARHGGSGDFSRQQSSEMSRLRRELTAPYTDLSVHHSMLASAPPVPVTPFKSTVDPVFSAHGDQLICNDALTSSRERLYEMMKQQQFCDAVLGTSLHSVKVHKAVLCSASAYLCGVLSQTCMGKSGGRILTVQFKADIPASSLSAFIDYIYQGRIKLSVKTVRDLNVMARCLHMESLKKRSEEMLVTLGTNNDTDSNIPELILLETLVDKLDKECTASFPVPTPTPPSHHVAVATDPSFFAAAVSEASCQTEDVPATPCSCSSSAVDLRSSGSSLRLGGLGTLSLAVNGGMSLAGEPQTSLMAVESKLGETSPEAPPTPVVKRHHKKHLASQASRIKTETATASTAPMPPLSVPPSTVMSTPSTITHTQTQKLSLETIAVTPSSRSTTPTPHPANKNTSGKLRKRTSTPTSSLSPALPSPAHHPVLPGQTARPIHHSYGTRAASRTPTKNLDLNFPQPAPGSKCAPLSKEFSPAEMVGVKETAGESSSEAQIQMAKHRGRTKKGRIAAALSEAFRTSSQDPHLASFSHPAQGENASLAAASGTDQSQVLSSSITSNMPPVSSVTTTTSTTTSFTEAKRSAPKAYRKHLIQSVASNQSLLAKKQACATESLTDEDKVLTTGCGEDVQNMSQPEVGCHGDREWKDQSLSSEQQRETVHSPITAKRKKKGKTRRMLLSSPNGSGGVRVRAPPKKRAKMELELEQLMREEMEEEEEEEESAAAGSTALKTELSETSESSGAQGVGQQQVSGSGTRIKMPSNKPGKRARWIKKDQLTPLLIALNEKAGSVTEGDCVFVCRLCNNEFMMPKRCLSHVMLTHKVPEGEVFDNIHVRKQQETEKCADESTISENLVCDICGYRSRDNTTYYLHYHKYFKHRIALPKGWSVFTCDLCGKELFTKFQLKDHKRTHAEKTPFVCEICGSGFQSRSNLHSHVFHRHKEEKKHSCDSCDRTFKTRTQLAVHERTHTGVRPFGCPLCPYRSTTRGNMRLHLVNRHKIDNSEARTIMQDMKPDIDVSLKSSWQNASSDSGGEKKSPTKRKSVNNNSNNNSNNTKLKKEKDVDTSDTLPSASPSLASKQDMAVESSTMELLFKKLQAPEKEPETAAGMAESTEQEDAGSATTTTTAAVMFAGDTEGSVVTLQAAEAFTASAGVGVGSETTAVTFLPQGLETMFHPPQPDLSSATSSAASAVQSTTIIVPENFLLQHQPQPFPHTHKPLYPQTQPQFTSFVVGAAPPLSTFTSSDLVVSATTLTPDALKTEVVGGGGGGGGVVDLADMEMGVMEGSLVEGSLRQGGLGSADLNLQASGSSVAQPATTATSSSSPSVSSSSNNNNAHLYMQHSPISPAPPISPTPVYVAVTPTPQPLTLAKQEAESQDTVATSTATTGGSMLVDHNMQQSQALHQYDASLLQTYYPGQFYSQSY